MPFYRIAKVSVGKTNRNPCDLVDVARRQVDHLGPIGIKAKKGQTDEVFLKRGYLRFVFPTVALRRKFADRVEEHCDSDVIVDFLKRHHP